jgi:hypothetical protein
MENYIAFVRNAEGSDTVWEMYECLVVLTLDFLKAQPTTYLKGLRRLDIRNPFPVPPARDSEIARQ